MAAAAATTMSEQPIEQPTSSEAFFKHFQSEASGIDDSAVHLP